jgi:hypothetical protein
MPQSEYFGSDLSIEQKLSDHEAFLFRLYNAHIELRNDRKQDTSSPPLFDKSRVSTDRALVALKDEVCRKLIRDETFAEAVRLGQELKTKCAALKAANDQLHETTAAHAKEIQELSKKIEVLRNDLEVKDTGCNLYKKKYLDAKKRNAELQNRVNDGLLDQKYAAKLRHELEHVQKELQLEKIKIVRANTAMLSKSGMKNRSSGSSSSSSRKRRTSSMSLAELTAEKRKKKNTSKKTVKWSIDGETVSVQKTRGFGRKR